MRRTEREIQDRAQVEAVLRDAPVGRLATVDPDGYPVIKPVNHVLHEGRIYFHTALEGEKIEHIRRDGRVGFEVDESLGYVPARGQACGAGYRYRSVIARGRAHLVTDPDEKREILNLLMAKYQPEGGYDPVDGDGIDRTGVVRIEMEAVTGKGAG